MQIHKLVFTILAIVVFPIASYAGTPTFADDPCDPEYYESLESRAWLEAQREITQNQNLIFKNDSVLEYTCFDRYMRELAAHAPDMFSETNRWGGTPPTDMRDALNNLVQDARHEYIDANFDHSLLGGRASFNYPNASSLSGSSYSCNIMQRVWEAAKCMDFIDNAANDGFFTFAEYASGSDKRFLPTACPGGADYTGNVNRAVVAANTPWDEDDAFTYYELIYPTSGDCEHTTGGGVARIQTGLEINVTSGSGVNRYNEYVCTVPGCYYEPSGLNSGTCQR